MEVLSFLRVNFRKFILTLGSVEPDKIEYVIILVFFTRSIRVGMGFELICFETLLQVSPHFRLTLDHAVLVAWINQVLRCVLTAQNLLDLPCEGVDLGVLVLERLLNLLIMSLVRFHLRN